MCINRVLQKASSASEEFKLIIGKAQEVSLQEIKLHEELVATLKKANAVEKAKLSAKSSRRQSKRWSNASMRLPFWKPSSAKIHSGDVDCVEGGGSTISQPCNDSQKFSSVPDLVTLEDLNIEQQWRELKAAAARRTEVCDYCIMWVEGKWVAPLHTDDVQEF